MTPPRLTFFCELAPEPLDSLINSQIITDLQSLQASLSLGILDMSAKRAAVVKRLNQAGIPVVAWLLLAKEQGYWFNLYNAPEAIARYEAFIEWTAVHELQWDGIGLDIEPDIQEMSQLAARKWGLVRDVFRRSLDYKGQRVAFQAYEGLVAQIRSDGYRLDSYQFPLIADERHARSKLLQRITGLVDIPADREVWMLYTSYLRPHGAGFIASYAPEAQSLGLGSTGDGVDVDLGGFRADPLTWKELERDLRLAWYYCDDLHIFSLEGCVKRGYLGRLKTFIWDYPILLPEDSKMRITAWRSALRSGLWFFAHLPAILIVLAGIMVFWKGIRRLLKRG